MKSIYKKVQQKLVIYLSEQEKNPKNDNMFANDI